MTISGKPFSELVFRGTVDLTVFPARSRRADGLAGEVP